MNERPPFRPPRDRGPRPPRDSRRDDRGDSRPPRDSRRDDRGDFRPPRFRRYRDEPARDDRAPGAPHPGTRDPERRFDRGAPRRPDERPPEPADAAEQFHTICGMRACLGAFESRREDILRFFYHRARTRPLQRVISWAVARDVMHRQMDDEALERVAHSPHHEGVAMTVRPQRCIAFNPRAAEAAAMWIALDGVADPAQLGGVIRAASFFGARGVVLGGVEPGTRLSGVTARAAAGGTETVGIFACVDLPAALAALREIGFAVAGVGPGGDRAVGREPLPRPGVLVIGGEGGLSAACSAACSAVYVVPSRSAGASLGAALTTGIALAEAFRATPPQS